MTLHFPPIKKTSWEALRTGLGIYGFMEIERLKKYPPSKEEIAEHREFRRNNPEPDYRKLLKEKLEIDGS